MLLAFDLDGTLVDSRDAVLKSYRAAGVEPPEDFWGKPWRAWLSDKRAHDRKNEEFRKPDTLKLVKRLKTMKLFCQDHSIVLTAASATAARVMLDYYDLRPAALFWELDAEGKVEVLNSHPSGIYFDDDKSICDMVKRRTSWTVMHVQT